MNLTLKQSTHIENLIQEYARAGRDRAYEVCTKANFKVQAVPLLKKYLDSLKDPALLRALSFGDMSGINKNHLLQTLRDQFFSRDFQPVASDNLELYALRPMEDDINQQALSAFESSILSVVEDWLRVAIMEMTTDILKKGSLGVNPKVERYSQTKNAISTAVTANLDSLIQSIFQNYTQMGPNQKNYLYKIYENSYSSGRAAVGQSFLSSPSTIVYQQLKEDFFQTNFNIQKGDVDFLDKLMKRNPDAVDVVLNPDRFESYSVTMYEQNFIDWNPPLDPNALQQHGLGEEDVTILAKTAYSDGVKSQVTRLATDALAEMARKEMRTKTNEVVR